MQPAADFKVCWNQIKATVLPDARGLALHPERVASLDQGHRGDSKEAGAGGCSCRVTGTRPCKCFFPHKYSSMVISEGETGWQRQGAFPVGMALSASEFCAMCMCHLLRYVNQVN